ncbi:TRAP transporter substrate-binding protein DctP [Thalassovita sp.]|uniref:TRAP transporter substrate-binding protein DctP n=1 Tax=Thalassovita sp. TaxID=1979401 RepID=UPI0029DE6FAE|nr:TRAP transporter substrate-binding protein DctP [Thalassovita sp.]
MKQIVWAACAALTLGAGTASQALELRLGMSAPEPTPWAAAAKEMAAKVAELSGGELTISPYFGNELGDGQTMARQLARGRLDMATLSNVEASLLLPEFGLLNAPYLFSGLEQADCVMDNHIGSNFNAAFEQAGAVYLASIEVGSMEIFSKQPFLTPSDIANQKIRTSPAPTDTYYVEATGAAAVPLGVPDTMPALKTGAVVGITTPVIMGVAGGYVAEAPEIILTDHSHQIGALLISKKTWDRLSDNQKNALTEGAKGMMDLRVKVRAVEQALLQKAVAGGARIHTLSPEAKAEWKAAAAEAQAKILTSIGGNAEQVWAGLQQATAACAQ